jgi:hypothetical protein
MHCAGFPAPDYLGEHWGGKRLAVAHPKENPATGRYARRGSGPCTLRRANTLGPLCNTYGGDVFREPFRSDRIAVLNSDTDICEVKGVGVRSTRFSAPLGPRPAGHFRHSRRQLFANAFMASSRVAA